MAGEIDVSSTYCTKQLAEKAEDLYSEVESKLGGVVAMEQYKQKSLQLQSEIKSNLGDTEPWRHDFIIHHLGLVGLIAVGRDLVKPIFDSLVVMIAKKFSAVALIPKVKGPERAGVKIRTRYGGDASQLSDIVRATLMFKIRPGSDVLADMYGAIEELVFMNELNGARARVTLLDDRYQNPRGGLQRYFDAYQN